MQFYSILRTAWSLHRAVHAGGQDTPHAEVEEEQVGPVDGGQLLHLVTLELLHEGGDHLAAGPALSGVDPCLLVPQEPGQAGAVHHGPQLPLAVQVHDVAEVTQTWGAVVSDQGPVRVLTLHIITSDWGLAAWHLRRPVCPWPAGTWQTPASWAPPRVCCCTSEAAPDPRQFLSELAASARQSCPAPALQTVCWLMCKLMNIQCTNPGQCVDISWGTPSAPLSCPCRRWPAWPWGASPPGCWPRPPPPAATRPSSSVTWSSGESRAGSPAPAPTHWSLTWTSAPSGSWRPPCSSSSTSTKSKV